MSEKNAPWETKTGKSFSFDVQNNAIRLAPESGNERTISNAEIEKFCELFNETQSYSTGTYREFFNKSYLVSITSRYAENLESFLPEEAAIEQLIKEGAVKQITVNTYERSASAKRKCIEEHGTDCAVCTLSFGSRYGDYASGFIHVHHLNPLSQSNGERIIDPVKDLRPVCPNCHAVIHLKGGCLSIEEAQKLINTAP
jgi:5-methylcytosine-specific restriction enzyme A